MLFCFTIYGFNFLRWEDEDGNEVTKIKNISSNVELFAKYEIDEDFLEKYR